jgi:hypothetical protein
MAVVSSQSIAGGIALDVHIPPAEIAKIQAMLKLVEPKLRRSLSRDLNKSLKPMAEQIEADFPPAPMSGLASRWGGVNASVRVDLNGPPNKALARFIIKANPPSFAKLLSITERAGSRSSGLTPQGTNLISNPRGGLQQRTPLVGRGGRFLFASFFKQRTDVSRKVLEALDRFIDKFNKGA